ncbi:3141_t:CDS:2 [Ambispora gerdemannii]|uniref:3141_t:CDS:1 n=1 Tax=Ambispora gerdemannii TaxID=144530 RepID=A0A9N9CKQ0_9GLOM|nr:3141_t:CDS:2 [Ambispora gerdemannii]
MRKNQQEKRLVYNLNFVHKNIKEVDSSQDYDDSQVDDYVHDDNDEEEVPAPEKTLDSVLNNKKTWILPSRRNFGDLRE